jgi:hypothetical protein
VLADGTIGPTINLLSDRDLRASAISIAARRLQRGVRNESFEHDFRAVNLLDPPTGVGALVGLVLAATLSPILTPALGAQASSAQSAPIHAGT